MTTSTNPTDDIIELTEIVEEGIPLNTKFEDFAMDKAVDAKSLDQELDDLLRESEPKSEAMQITDDEIELDILFEEPSSAMAQPEPPTAAVKTAPADPGMDMSDIDDLFDSLGIGEKETGDTALDIILDGDIPQQPEKKAVDTFYPSDSIDLDLDLPGTGESESGKAIHDLTEELLADIPETVLLHSPEETRLESTKQASTQIEPLETADTAMAHDESVAAGQELPADDGPEPEMVLEDVPAAVMAKPEVAKSPADQGQPVAAAVEATPEQTLPPAEQAAPLETGFSLAAIESIDARLDALESRPEPAPLGAEELLALLPSSPQDMPATRSLRQEILDHVESRILELDSSSRIEGLQESLNSLHSRLDALPDMQEELTKKLADSSIPKMEADIEDLRLQIRDKADLQPEHILALLPQSPQGWPVTQALRQEIIDHVESRVSELASSSSVDGLQESVNALQSQVEAIPDIRAELAKTPAASLVNKMEAELGELKALVQSQDETLGLMRQALADKDAVIAALAAEGNSLRAELHGLAAKIDAAPAPDVVQSELRQYVQQQVPLAAAKIIREEIQALLKELGG